MKTRIFLSTCCVVGLSFLQGCSESDNDSGPWSSPGEIHTTSAVASSKVSSNSRGDIVVAWEDVEQEIRINQALNDAHDPDVPYPVDADISPVRIGRHIGFRYLLIYSIPSHICAKYNHVM